MLTAWLKCAVVVVGMVAPAFTTLIGARPGVERRAAARRTECIGDGLPGDLCWLERDLPRRRHIRELACFLVSKSN